MNSVLCAHVQSSLIPLVGSPASPEILLCREPVRRSKSQSMQNRRPRLQSGGVGPLLHVGKISWSDQLL